MAGVLMLLTAYKLFSYRKRMNQTWAAPYHIYGCRRLTCFIAQSCHACPWLYYLLYHHFWSVASIEELLALISTICYLLACLTLDIASNVDIAFTFNVST
jgi:hypothetical protein